MEESSDAVKVSGPDEDDINANNIVEDDNCDKKDSADNVGKEIVHKRSPISFIEK
jgi:hypothetical protein